LGEPPLADASRPGGPTGAPAEGPAKAAPATEQAEKRAASNRTLLYVFNGTALAALAGWLIVAMHRRRFR
jgi:hypothetical protein